MAETTSTTGPLKTVPNPSAGTIAEYVKTKDGVQRKVRKMTAAERKEAGLKAKG